MSAALLPSCTDGDRQAPDQGKLLRLVGYNCRQTFLRIVPLFMARMARFELRPVDYSILTLVHANPEINQKRLAQAINVSPPNLAPLLDRLENRDLLVRRRNPADKRSQTLALTPAGLALCEEADRTAFTLEVEATAMLSEEERTELLRLLQKVFLDQPDTNESTQMEDCSAGERAPT